MILICNCRSGGYKTLVIMLNGTMNKRPLLKLTLLLLLFSSCMSYIQIFDTQTIDTKTNVKLTDGYYVCETDTFKVIYEFWAEKGVMAFSVYNKTDKPLYIDWRNSSFIYNSDKNNYWNDEITTKTLGVSYNAGYFYRGPLVLPGYTVGESSGIQSSVSKTTKPERVTFIPPKSYYYSKIQFSLYRKNNFTFGKTAYESVVPRNDKPKKETNVCEEDFDYTKSPLKFRNYLAFSFSETNPTFFFCDNEFYLSSVREMDYRHYRGQHSTKNGEIVYSKPFKKKSSFYIKISNENSVARFSNSFPTKEATDKSSVH